MLVSFNGGGSSLSPTAASIKRHTPNPCQTSLAGLTPLVPLWGSAKPSESTAIYKGSPSSRVLTLVSTVRYAAPSGYLDTQKDGLRSWRDIWSFVSGHNIEKAKGVAMMKAT